LANKLGAYYPSPKLLEILKTNMVFALPKMHNSSHVIT